MLIRSKRLILTLVAVLIAASVLAQEPDVVVGEIPFPQHVWGKQTLPFEVTNKTDWLKFGFPLMYQTDALEILAILTKLGYHDPRMQEAIDLLLSKQDDQGRWTLETTFNGRFQVDIEEKDKPSKWITLNALKVLKSYASGGN